MLGPFYVPDAQRMPLGASISKDGVGEPMPVSGRVIDTAGQPIADATLDVCVHAPAAWRHRSGKSLLILRSRGS